MWVYFGTLLKQCGATQNRSEAHAGRQRERVETSELLVELWPRLGALLQTSLHTAATSLSYLSTLSQTPRQQKYFARTTVENSLPGCYQLWIMFHYGAISVSGPITSHSSSSSSTMSVNISSAHSRPLVIMSHKTKQFQLYQIIVIFHARQKQFLLRNWIIHTLSKPLKVRK